MWTGIYACVSFQYLHILRHWYIENYPSSILNTPSFVWVLNWHSIRLQRKLTIFCHHNCCSRSMKLLVIHINVDCIKIVCHEFWTGRLNLSLYQHMNHLKWASVSSDSNMKRQPQCIVVWVCTLYNLYMHTKLC